MVDGFGGNNPALFAGGFGTVVVAVGRPNTFFTFVPTRPAAAALERAAEAIADAAFPTAARPEATRPVLVDAVEAVFPKPLTTPFAVALPNPLAKALPAVVATGATVALPAAPVASAAIGAAAAPPVITVANALPIAIPEPIFSTVCAFRSRSDCVFSTIDFIGPCFDIAFGGKTIVLCGMPCIVKR